MPRNLARLRFRAPKQVRTINPLAGMYPYDRAALHNRLRNHTLDLSKPQTPLSLHVVVNPRWKQQPGKKTQKLAFKPHTVKDLVDPEAKAKHGQIIYVFANIKTGQVLYSLVEMLENYHLDQLPFLGKHSKPPAVRPDDWTPHCVITFPFAQQGLQAFRKLREFRHLHETSWDKTNPEWIRLTAASRMKRIMNQVANTSADMAEVLTIQRHQSADMQKRFAEQEEKSTRLMNKMWDEVETLAKDTKDASNPKWLEQQIKSLERQRGTKRNRDEDDQERIKNAIKSHEVRFRKVRRARRKVEELEQSEKGTLTMAGVEVQEEYSTQKPRAKGQAKRDKFTKDVAAQDKELSDASKLSQEDVRRSILPEKHRNTLPRPFEMNVEIKWADLRNAEYAAGNWPNGVFHDILDLRSSRQDVHFMNTEQYQSTVQSEVESMVKDLERQALEAQGLADPEPEPEPEKTGVWKYLPEVKNPFKRAEA